jgi:hypothetical protein
MEEPYWHAYYIIIISIFCLVNIIYYIINNYDIAPMCLAK